MLSWYILQVHSGNEKKVEKELMIQLEKKGLKNNIEKIEIPSEEVVEMKKSKKVSINVGENSIVTIAPFKPSKKFFGNLFHDK